MVGGGGAAEQRRNRNSGEVVGVAPAMVVAGWMGLWLWEVQEDEADPFRGSTGVEGGCMGCSTELRRRPAMVATNVASLMVLGDGGWVGEDQRKVGSQFRGSDLAVGARREELGEQGGLPAFMAGGGGFSGAQAGARARRGELCLI